MAVSPYECCDIWPTFSQSDVDVVSGMLSSKYDKSFVEAAFRVLPHTANENRVNEVSKMLQESKYLPLVIESKVPLVI